MLIFNLTGLSRFYWFPVVQGQNDHAGLWYWSLRFLGLEVIGYSREMGAAFIYGKNHGKIAGIRACDHKRADSTRKDV